ncbi:hypothetical protein [Nereida sp. MMG025]|uniref:hypothetical protein n=1 Tax=Nereida sp. MMG025 TaxID=2909981 RepID=UPI001F42EF17|nr:hypothetical protein [Nereida sp. MMG025]MCF6446111.1 hypothetical protein [Nereida sp. MMG025]
MQDLSEEDRAYLTRMMDLSHTLILAAHDDATGEEAELNYDMETLFEIIDKQLTIVVTREDPDGFEISLAPPDAFRLLIPTKDKLGIIAEGITPREFYRVVLAILEAFPQQHRLYVNYADIGYAWLRTDLPEDEAVLHMITHDDGVRATLGLPAYDHSQW